MTTILKDQQQDLDGGSEVKRLQDLVKKLEQQNHVLRNKQRSDISDTKISHLASNTSKLGLNGTCDDGDNQMQMISNVIANSVAKESLNADADLLDVETLTDDEESWLYSLPKKPSPKQAVSPYKWVREEFEHPSPEVENVKRSLLYRINEASRLSKSASAGVLTNRSTSPSYSSNGPSIKKALGATPNSGGINTGTFSIRKGRLTKCNSATSSKELQDNFENENSDHSSASSQERKLDPYSGASRAEDMVDIQVLARMQEESLRQSLHSHKSPRKRLTVRQDGSPQSSNRSSPGKYEGDARFNIEKSDNSLASMSSQSNSPSESPYGSQYLEEKSHGNHRRSLPNLSQPLQPVLPSHPSDTNLHNRTVSSSPSRIPPSNSTSPYKHLGATKASVSPDGSPRRTAGGGIPRPAGSGIPRPGASRLPKKSSIPSPSRRQQPSRRLDDSWKDGCF